MDELKKKVALHGLPEEAFKHLKITYPISNSNIPEINVNVIKYSCNKLDIKIGYGENVTLIDTCDSFCMLDLINLLETFNVVLTNAEKETLEFNLNVCIHHYNRIEDGTDLIDYKEHGCIATLQILAA